MCLWGPDEKDQQEKWTNTGKAWNADDPADGHDGYFYHAFDLLILIKITIAAIFIYSRGTDFSQLNSAGTSSVEITGITGTIKKYVDPKKPPENNLTDITTGETLTQGTQLEINATGEITKPTSAGEVTIKATLDVTSAGTLGTTELTLAADPADPSSTGLSGTITPKGDKDVTIREGSNITLTGTALNALKSLTKNAVTLKDSAGKFESKATITITGTDFTALDLKSGDSLEITISGGTIRNSTNDLQTGSPPLKENDVLDLNATGTITEPETAKNKVVTIEGTIVVTSEGNIGTPLTITGGPSSGVGGTFSLGDESSPDKHVKIQATSNLTINQTAYTGLDKTEDSLKIGASKSDPRNPSSAAGAGELASEDSFQNYCHLLHTNNI